jgi:hypothetical protein
MPFILGVLIAIGLSATLVAVSLANFFGEAPIFVALGQSLAILGAAAFAWWLARVARCEPDPRIKFWWGAKIAGY